MEKIKEIMNDIESGGGIKYLKENQIGEERREIGKN